MTQEEELKKGRREIRKVKIVQGKREQERESARECELRKRMLLYSYFVIHQVPLCGRVYASNC